MEYARLKRCPSGCEKCESNGQHIAFANETILNHAPEGAHTTAAEFWTDIAANSNEDDKGKDDETIRFFAAKKYSA
ncbi:hypothetical protein amad1_08590 [Alteromonas mediterranea DE1]|nr:hypothetical protein amad1_08590 [Alteromonas mediterranea DE1]AGP97240.1 hypothetical protein I635_08580 [Alteromonas mediterranea UM7]